MNSHQAGCLHYRIGTKENLPRIWRIAHVLLTECERRGYVIQALADGPGRCRGGVAVEISGVVVEIVFNERGKRGPARKTNWGSVQTVEPTGLLQILAEHSSSYSGAVLASDSEKRWRLEDRVDAALRKLEALGATRLKQRADNERRQIDRRYQAMLRERERLREEEERRRFEELGRLVADYQLARDIRAFVSDAVLVRPWTSAELRLLDWARSEADRIDPLLKTRPGYPGGIESLLQRARKRPSEQPDWGDAVHRRLK